MGIHSVLQRSASYDQLRAERDRLAAERDAYLQQRDIAISERNELQRQRDVAIGERNELQQQLAEVRQLAETRRVTTTLHGPVDESLQTLKGGMNKLRTDLSELVAILSEWRLRESR
jgi:uncharacterized coiled-coil DUF342 family protein